MRTTIVSRVLLRSCSALVWLPGGKSLALCRCDLQQPTHAHHDTRDAVPVMSPCIGGRACQLLSLSGHLVCGTHQRLIELQLASMHEGWQKLSAPWQLLHGRQLGHPCAAQLAASSPCQQPRLLELWSAACTEYETTQSRHCIVFNTDMEGPLRRQSQGVKALRIPICGCVHERKYIVICTFCCFASGPPRPRPAAGLLGAGLAAAPALPRPRPVPLPPLLLAAAAGARAWRPANAASGKVLATCFSLCCRQQTWGPARSMD